MLDSVSHRPKFKRWVALLVALLVALSPASAPRPRQRQRSLPPSPALALAPPPVPIPIPPNPSPIRSQLSSSPDPVERVPSLRLIQVVGTNLRLPNSSLQHHLHRC
ncbi:hypothetical protein EDB80DRAFT_169823 [Ilyonectria destructans]|nr:hypothetical protein EDB80DRAFT_169823 [Ilyonectria destructans]